MTSDARARLVAAVAERTAGCEASARHRRLGQYKEYDAVLANEISFATVGYVRLADLTALLADYDRMREALEPFAAIYDEIANTDNDLAQLALGLDSSTAQVVLSVGDLRRARQSLTPENEDG